MSVYIAENLGSFATQIKGYNGGITENLGKFATKMEGVYILHTTILPRTIVILYQKVRSLDSLYDNGDIAENLDTITNKT